MKRRFVMVLALMSLMAIWGCGGTDTTTTPDTTPPLAPELAGADVYNGTIGVWWGANTEPDLAGYYVYYVQNGQSADLENLLQRAFTPRNVTPTTAPGGTAPGAEQVSMSLGLGRNSAAGGTPGSATTRRASHIVRCAPAIAASSTRTTRST